MGHISFVGKLDAVTLSAGAPAIAPGLTLDLMAKHSLDFWLTSEDLPDPDNRVTLDRDGNIVLSYTPNNEEGHKRLIAKLEDAAAAADDLPRARPQLPPGAVLAQPVRRPAHSAGRRRPPERHRSASATTRRPRRSTRNCRAHEVDNLYVVDGSFFPSSGAVNPALTIMANALRVGDHLLGEAGTDVARIAHSCAGMSCTIGVCALSCWSCRCAHASPRPLVAALARVGRGASA